MRHPSLVEGYWTLVIPNSVSFPGSATRDSVAKGRDASRLCNSTVFARNDARIMRRSAPAHTSPELFGAFARRFERTVLCLRTSRGETASD